MPPFETIQKQLKDFASGLSVKQGLTARRSRAAHDRDPGGICEPDRHTRLQAPGHRNGTRGRPGFGRQAGGKEYCYQISTDGKTVNVPGDKLDTSRMEVASDGMPRSGRLGFELFDKLNWGQTEFDEKVNYQRALEGELERSIQTLKGCRQRASPPGSADGFRVHRSGAAAKASVVLKLRSGRLSEETQLGIARLVAGAVDNLSPRKCDGHRCGHQSSSGHAAA